MKRLFYALFGLPLAIVLIAFAIANRGMVVVSFDPITPAEPWFSLSLPLWLVLFAGIFIGLVAGGIATWIGQGKWRRTARNAKQSANRLEADNERLRRQEKQANRAKMPLARLDAPQA